MTAAGWDRCFARLRIHLAGEREALELWPVVHERYAEEFSLELAPGASWTDDFGCKGVLDFVLTSRAQSRVPAVA